MYMPVCVCRPEDSFQILNLPFQHVGHWDRAQVVRLGVEHLYTLNHLPSPLLLLYSAKQNLNLYCTMWKAGNRALWRHILVCGTCSNSAQKDAEDFSSDDFLD